MFTLSSSLTFQLYSKPTDMRKSFDSLCGLVQNQLDQTPTNGDVYVFINKTRNKIKLLHWAAAISNLVITDESKMSTPQ